MLARRHVGGAAAISAYALEALLRSLDSGSLLHPSAPELRPALDRVARASAASADEQEESVRGAVAAVRARGGRFGYAHDFFAYDMDGGRSPAGRLLLARRRAAVRAAGGEFIDLWEELGPEVGVAWFDDFIHPSAWAHRIIARRLCRALGAD